MASAQGRASAEIWSDKAFAAAWADGDTIADLLVLPRRIAAAIVEGDRPTPGLIVDVGSGPGAFLAEFLGYFPRAHGIWTDASEAMHEKARTELAAYGDRVEYKILDMTEIGAGALPTGIDALITSRAVHHLDAAGLRAFYTAAADLLAPGGWLINLDHTGSPWDARLRAARKTIVPPRPTGGAHHHDAPLTTVADHYAALEAAGFTDYDAPWRAFLTVLFMARKQD